MYLQVRALVALMPTSQSASALHMAASYRLLYSLPSFRFANPSLIALSVTDDIHRRRMGLLHPVFFKISRATSSPSLPASVAMIISPTSPR